MGSFGWHNPFPMQLGGGSTLVERHYNTLRNAVGRGGSAEDAEDSMEAIWRQRKAVTMAALEAWAERAAIEALPSKATDLLDYYERALGVVPRAGQSEEDRRRVVAEKFTRAVSAVTETVELGLQRIDPRFQLAEPPESAIGRVIEGRSFEPFDGTPTYDQDGPQRSTLFPMFSDDFIVTVVFANAGPAPTRQDLQLISEAQDFLNETLPAWVGFRVLTSIGFILDQSPLDLTGFGT